MEFKEKCRRFGRRWRRILSSRGLHKKPPELVSEQMLDDSLDAVLLTDESGAVLECNAAAERLFGMPAAQLEGRHTALLISHLGDAIDGDAPRCWECRATRGADEAVPLGMALKLNGNSARGRHVIFLRDMTRRILLPDGLTSNDEELERRVRERTAQLEILNSTLQGEIVERRISEQKLQRLATTDSLTGMLNRREFDRLLHLEFDRALRYRTPLSLLMFDVDHFKAINDAYGHAAGDAVLVSLSAFVKANIRNSDIFARWGGEEFVLLLPRAGAEQAHAAAEKLRSTICKRSFAGLQQITCSFGVADHSRAASGDHLVQLADSQLYRAKQRGRNRVCAGNPRTQEIGQAVC